MGFSLTGLAYFLNLFSAGFLTYRFLQYWKKEGTLVAKIFFYFMAVFSIFFSVTAIPTLFLAKSTLALRIADISTAFLEGVAGALLGCLIAYLWLKKISPWLGFIVPLVLGIIATVLLILFPPSPFLESDLSINWGDQGAADIFRSLIYLITFLPMAFILVGQYLKASNPYAKSRALGMWVIFAFSMIVALLDYGVEKIFHLRPVTSDISQIILSIFLFIFLLITQRSPQEAGEERLPVGYSRTVR
ncbi:MAG: hypothetical protein Q7S70_02260 [bacterium]|nr:hypothetical protein [bacterium]